MYNWMSEKTHKYCEIKGPDYSKSILSKNKEWIEKKNENYTPKIFRPAQCFLKNKKRIPSQECLCNAKGKKCPFFAFGEVEPEEFEVADKAINKLWETKEWKEKHD